MAFIESVEAEISFGMLMSESAASCVYAAGAVCLFFFQSLLRPKWVISVK